MGTPDNGWYHVDRDGKQQGPSKRANLLEMHSNNEVDNSTLVWVHGLDGWKSLDSVLPDFLPPPVPRTVPPPIPSSATSDATSPFVAPATTTPGLFPPAHVRYYKRPDEAAVAMPAPQVPQPTTKIGQIVALDIASADRTDESVNFARIYAVCAHVLLIVSAGIIFELLQLSNGPTFRDVLALFGMGAGIILVSILVGLLGLLNKKARLQTFVLISWSVFVLFVYVITKY